MEGTDTEAGLVVNVDVDGDGLVCFVVGFVVIFVVSVVVDCVVRLVMLQLSPKLMSSIAISP